MALDNKKDLVDVSVTRFDNFFEIFGDYFWKEEPKIV